MDSYAVATTGESLWIEDDSGVLKEIEELKTCPAVMRTPQRLDCTHMKCSVMTYKDGIPDLGELQWTCNAMGLNAPNSNIEILRGLDRKKARKVVMKLPAIGYQIIMQGQINYGFAERSVNSILDLTITLTTCSDYSIVSLDETYTVTYDAGEATGTVTDSESYAPGDSVEVKDASGLTYEGHQFTGWSLSEDGSGTLLQAGESFTIYSNTTLYAQWIATPASMSVMSETPVDDGVGA